MRLTVARWLVERGRVFHALLARELITRYGRHNIGFLWLLVEPMLFASAVAALWVAVKGTMASPGMSVVGFALTGYATVLLWRNAAGKATQAMKINWAILYHKIVHPIDLYIVRIYIEVGSATISFLILSFGAAILGLMSFPHDPSEVLLAWFALMFFSFGFSLFIGALATLSETFEKIWHMLTYILFPLSGAPFLLAWLPPHLAEVLAWVPMVHGTEWLRGAWFGPSIRTYEDPAYFLTCSAVFLFLGLLLIRHHGRVIEIPA